MSRESNRFLARAYFTTFRNRAAARWDRFIAPGFVRHDPDLDFQVRGPAGIAKLGEVLHGAFQEIALPIDKVIA